MATKTKTEPIQKDASFSKEQLLASERFKNRKDILGVLLADSKCYTVQQVDDLLQKFMKGTVK